MWKLLDALLFDIIIKYITQIPDKYWTYVEEYYKTLNKNP